MKNIIDKMRRQYPVSDDSLLRLESCLHPCRFSKRTRLIREGVRNKVAYFLENGMTRSFWSVDGDEVTTSFSTEGDIVFSMDELYYDRPSEEVVEALENIEAYAIPVDDLNRLFRTDLDLANWGRIIHQNEYRRLHRTHKDRLTLSAKARYEEMKRQFPAVCERVNLGYIASYLGITLPTLSRIRAEE